MEWFLWIMAVVVLGVAAIVGSGRLGEMPDVVRDTPTPALPDGPLTGADLLHVNFATTWNGYSPEQVDALLARLATQLDAVSPEFGSVCDNGNGMDTSGADDPQE